MVPADALDHHQYLDRRVGLHVLGHRLLRSSGLQPDAHGPLQGPIPGVRRLELDAGADRHGCGLRCVCRRGHAASVLRLLSPSMETREGWRLLLLIGSRTAMGSTASCMKLRLFTCCDDRPGWFRLAGCSWTHFPPAVLAGPKSPESSKPHAPSRREPRMIGGRPFDMADEWEPAHSVEAFLLRTFPPNLAPTVQKMVSHLGLSLAPSAADNARNCFLDLVTFVNHPEMEVARKLVRGWAQAEEGHAEGDEPEHKEVVPSGLQVMLHLFTLFRVPGGTAFEDATLFPKGEPAPFVPGFTADPAGASASKGKAPLRVIQRSSARYPAPRDHVSPTPDAERGPTARSNANGRHASAADDDFLPPDDIAEQFSPVGDPIQITDPASQSPPKAKAKKVPLRRPKAKPAKAKADDGDDDDDLPDPKSIGKRPASPALELPVVPQTGKKRKIEKSDEIHIALANWAKSKDIDINRTPGQLGRYPFYMRITEHGLSSLHISFKTRVIRMEIEQTAGIGRGGNRKSATSSVGGDTKLKLLVKCGAAQSMALQYSDPAASFFSLLHAAVHAIKQMSPESDEYLSKAEFKKMRDHEDLLNPYHGLRQIQVDPVEPRELLAAGTDLREAVDKIATSGDPCKALKQADGFKGACDFCEKMRDWTSAKEDPDGEGGEGQWKLDEWKQIRVSSTRGPTPNPEGQDDEVSEEPLLCS